MSQLITFMNPLPFTVNLLHSRGKKYPKQASRLKWAIRRWAISSSGAEPIANGFLNLSCFQSSHCYCSVYKVITCPRKAGRHIHIWGGWAAPLKTSCNNLSHNRLKYFKRSSCPLSLLPTPPVPLVLVKQTENEADPKPSIFYLVPEQALTQFAEQQGR